MLEEHQDYLNPYNSTISITVNHLHNSENEYYVVELPHLTEVCKLKLVLTEIPVELHKPHWDTSPATNTSNVRIWQIRHKPITNNPIKCVIAFLCVLFYQFHLLKSITPKPTLICKLTANHNFQVLFLFFSSQNWRQDCGISKASKDTSMLPSKTSRWRHLRRQDLKVWRGSLLQSVYLQNDS